MRKIACIALGGTFALLTGCATIGATPGKQVAAPENGDDGVVKQRVEFKDLSPWEQEVILHGGGGE